MIEGCGVSWVVDFGGIVCVCVWDVGDGVGGVVDFGVVFFIVVRDEGVVDFGVLVGNLCIVFCVGLEFVLFILKLIFLGKYCVWRELKFVIFLFCDWWWGVMLLMIERVLVIVYLVYVVDFWVFVIFLGKKGVIIIIIILYLN